MPIRLGGLVSGFDTEAIIRDMMSAQSLKKQNIQKKLTKLEWKEEKWKDLNTKLYNLYRNEVSKLRSQSSYLTKSVTSSDDSKVKVTAGSKVPAGSHTLTIEQTATAQYITGGEVATKINGRDSDINDSTRIVDVQFTNTKISNADKRSGFLAIGTTLELEIGGKKDYFTIQSDTTISDMTSWFKERGIAFSYDKTFKRFHVSSLQTGDDNKFTLTSSMNISAKDESANITSLMELNGFNKLDESIKSSEMKEKLEFAQNILKYGTDSESLMQEAKNIFTAAAKAEENVYRVFMHKKFTEIIEDDSEKENLELRWEADGSYRVYNTSQKKDVTDAYSSQLSKYSRESTDEANKYKFETAMNDIDLRPTYSSSFTEALEKLKLSQNSLDAGKTASEVLGYTKGNEIEACFDTISKVDMLSFMAGGVYALSTSKKAEIEAQINTYRDPGSSEVQKAAAKTAIEKYSQADDIARKEVYKAYIEKSWKQVIGSNTDFKLEWDTDGNYSIVKVNMDSKELVASMRQSMNEYKNRYNFDQIMNGTDKALGDKSYKDIYNEQFCRYSDGAYNGSFQSKVTLENSFETIEKEKKALDMIGVGEVGSPDYPGISGVGAKFMKASNMKCTFNGCAYSYSSNTVTINGLTITALGQTTSPLTLNVNNDSTSVFDMVKTFVKQYNEVVKAASDQYYAKLAKGYDVLTDDEKEQMTDKQVEKWEDKIKDQILRRDSTLNSILSVMRSITSETVMVDGKEYNLSMFGINTGDYSERGLLHLDGDPDDPTTSGNENKLKAALEKDPDIVMKVLTKIGDSLYTKMADKMSSTKLSSALTFYNDKEITDLKKSYEDQIKEWDKKLKTIEDNYYKKFSKMEAAMSKLNSQTANLTSLFGVNN